MGGWLAVGWQPQGTIIGSVNRLVGRELFAQMEMRF